MGFRVYLFKTDLDCERVLMGKRNLLSVLDKTVDSQIVDTITNTVTCTDKKGGDSPLKVEVEIGEEHRPGRNLVKLTFIDGSVQQKATLVIFNGCGIGYWYPGNNIAWTVFIYSDDEE